MILDRKNDIRKGIALALLPALVICAISTVALAAAGTFYATSTVSAGDVVVWDASVDYGVKTTSTEGAQAVAGVADESVTANNTCIVRQDGGRVAINVAGTVSRGQWLITSATAGKAKGVNTAQPGVFARAVTGSGVPAPGQCYASLELGFLAFGGGPAQDHAVLSNLNWSAAGHTFDTTLDIGAQDFKSTGNFTDGTNAVSAAQAKTAYDHSQITQDAHGLTYTAEGAGGGLDADTVDGSHASAFAASSHTHTESEITDLVHDAQKIKGKTVDDAGLADGKIWKYEAATQSWIIADDAGASGSGAPIDAPYITQTHDATLINEQALSDLDTGIMKSAAGTGVVSIAQAGTDYSLPIIAENNDVTVVGGIASINVNGEDLRFTNPSGSQVNLEFGTVYGTESGGTRTIYVNGTTGSDSNLGTSGSPLATIQKAWDVLPAIVTDPIVIDIAAGMYNEACVFSGKQMGSATGSITIQGALTNSDTGTATGTQSSTTLQDTSKSWTTNEHQYKLLRLTGGTGSGQYAWIISNTANTLTIAGQWTATPVSTGTTYSIDELATVVNGGAGSESIYVDNMQNLALKYLKGTTCLRFIYLDNKTECSIIACKASGSGVASSAFRVAGKSYLQSDSEAIFADDTGNVGLDINGQSFCGALNRTYVRSCGSLGIQSSQRSFLYLYRSRTDGNTNYGIRALSDSTVLFATGGGGCQIVNETYGIYAANGSSIWSASQMSFSGCGTNYGADGTSNAT